jgi:putative spermidine/putrescine transport system substrate-binding protein
VVKWPTEPDAASQLLNSGEVVLTDGLQARLQNQIDQGALIGIEWNQGMMTIDFWTVAKGAPNKANAMKFLAFTTKAENQVKFFNVIPYGPTNKKTLSLLKPDRLKDLPTSPGNREKHFFRNAEWWAQKGPSGKTNIELVNERWTSWVLE